MSIQKLTPACKDYLWGGVKLKEKYGKSAKSDVLAETWELSFHPDGPTLGEDGRPLSESVTAEQLGENVQSFPFFPVLVKFIDAKNDLSFQVHPSDDYALQNENSFGKTEMWYVVEAEAGAGIYLGFNRDVTRDEVRRAVADGSIGTLLNFYPVRAGETYFIPSGIVHAICHGCLILEIQQNSNLTYRVYDYDRVDKNGQKRPLHVEKALAVMRPERFIAKKQTGDLLGACRYFTARKYVGEQALATDGKTFHCLTCVRGKGKIGDRAMAAGDSFFISADHGAYRVTGEAEVVVTTVRRYYLGIDLGGTFIKGGAVDDAGNILVSDKVETDSKKGADAVAGKIADLCLSLLAAAGLSVGDVVGIGIGVPGLVDGERGEVLYSNNLGWSHFQIADAVKQKTGIPVKIANDADAATLGEFKFGAGRGADDLVMITLGTGVGSGVIANGRLYTGNRRAGVEIGHTVLRAGGRLCTCGRRGCFEAYCSASALVRQTKRAMQKNKQSKLWEIGGLDRVDGKTAFAFYDRDETAKKVVDDYMRYLAEGLVNISSMYRPQMIVIGGGVSAEPGITVPLQAAVDKHSFGGELAPRCRITAAEAGNRAGTIGAAALWMED